MVIKKGAEYFELDGSFEIWIEGKGEGEARIKRMG